MSFGTHLIRLEHFVSTLTLFVLHINSLFHLFAVTCNDIGCNLVIVNKGMMFLVKHISYSSALHCLCSFWKIGTAKKLAQEFWVYITNIHTKIWVGVHYAEENCAKSEPIRQVFYMLYVLVVECHVICHTNYTNFRKWTRLTTIVQILCTWNLFLV